MGDPHSSGGKSDGDRDEKGKFRPGHSLPGPGRRPGSRWDFYKGALKQAVTESDLQEVFTMMLDQAKEGCRTSQKFLVERCLGKPREEPEEGFAAFDLPELVSAADCVTAAGRILAAASSGSLPLDQATRLVGIVEAMRKAIETTQFEARLAALEGSSGGSSTDLPSQSEDERYS